MLLRRHRLVDDHQTRQNCDDDDDDDPGREWIIGNNTTTVHQLQYQQIIKHAEKTNEETKKMDYLTGLFYGNFILVPS